MSSDGGWKSEVVRDRAEAVAIFKLESIDGDSIIFGRIFAGFIYAFPNTKPMLLRQHQHHPKIQF